MALVMEVYRITKRFPSEEKYGLTQQVRRAAVSIPSNVAEGAARNTKKEFTHFLHGARGSLSELDTQLELSVGLGYVSDDDLNSVRSLMEQVDRMISGLLRSLRGIR